jgi:CubicO group peptidase (beta-lactamase class C family)
MGKFRRIGAAMLCGALVASGAHAKAPGAGELGFSAERLQRLDDRLQQEIDTGKYAGFCLVILRHRQAARDRCYGSWDLDARQPMRRDAIYRIASMTKPIAGTALMILFEEGKWQLDDPVAKFAPEFAGLEVAQGKKRVPLAHPITMRELLTSTAGFAAGHPIGSVDPDVDKQYAAAKLTDGTLAEMAAKLAKLPLESQPGTHFRYGIQHDIQGYLVERISGQSFDRFLADRLFRPLGMVDTDFGVAPEKRERIAPLYAYDAQMKLTLAANQGTFHSPTAGEKPRFLSGAGGLYSTMADYQRYVRMLANGGSLDGVRILSPSTVQLMMSDMLPEGVKLTFLQPIEGVGYGADLGIVLDPGRASFNSGGLGKGTAFWTGAHGTWFWIDPVNDMQVIGMVQQEGAAAAHMGIPAQAPDLRALSRSLIYAALVEPKR